MRDPNRIPEFCNRLAEIWGYFPDWRFGQLISNLTNRKDIFYIEDNELLKEIENSWLHTTTLLIPKKEDKNHDF